MKCCLKFIPFYFLVILVTAKTYAQNVVTSYAGRYTTFTVKSDKLILHGNSMNAVSYQWYYNGKMISGALNKDLTATSSGMYSVVAFNAIGCNSERSDTVIVDFVKTVPVAIAKADSAVDLMVTVQSPNATETLGKKYTYTLVAANNSTTPGTQVTVKFSMPSNITLEQSSAESEIQYDAGTRTVTWAINQLKKTDPLSLNLMVSATQPGDIQCKAIIQGIQADPNLSNNSYVVRQTVNALIIPNVFTPNGDGINDTFFIIGLDNYLQSDLIITNRWGSEVYVKKNYRNDWSGDSLPEGTYFYILNAKSSTGSQQVFKGYITILRSHL